jgi:hypothetical protein
MFLSYGQPKRAPQLGEQITPMRVPWFAWHPWQRIASTAVITGVGLRRQFGG